MKRIAFLIKKNYL